MRRFVCTLASALLFATAPAWAACTVPVPPDATAKPAKLVPPIKGPCVDAKPGAAGCLGWEGYKFNDEVKAFNAKVPAFKAEADAYLRKLNDYVAAASSYAKCEVDTLR